MAETLDYREIIPPLALRPHVRCIWRLVGPCPTLPQAEPIVPDGCAELVLNLGDAFTRHTPDELSPSHRQPLRLVAGQITRAITIEPSGRVDLWGIRFHPWAAAAFLGVSAEELRDQFLTLEEAQTPLERELRNLIDLEGDTARYDAIVAALMRRARRITEPDGLLPGLIGLAEGRRDSLSVRGLAKEAGVSTRRVQMLFRDRVGLSPKQLLRIARFQRALALARAEPRLSWGAIAVRAGYYDQAHLIHESNEIVGCTPSTLLGHDAGLTDAFLTD